MGVALRLWEQVFIHIHDFRYLWGEGSVMEPLQISDTPVYLRYKVLKIQSYITEEMDAS